MKKHNVLIGITGGISAYKIPNLCRIFIKNNYNVKIIMTENATRFITPLTLETIVNYRVYVNEFGENREIGAIEHIELVDWADVIIIAPATANTIAKIAHGIGDNLLTSLMLVASNKTTFICPAMNTRMYLNPVTRQNIEILEELGFSIIEPGEGELACGDVGPGRLRDVEDIFDIVNKRVNTFDNFKGIKFIITAGPTIEYIDPVRFISNKSSGKMGVAIADYANSMGGEVLLIGHVSHLIRKAFKTEIIDKATEMLDLLKDHMGKCDILIMAAAVADFKPKKIINEKIKKGKGLTLELEENPDILKELSKLKNDRQVFIGFAAETGNKIENARKKLIEKKLDMIVFNDVSRRDIGFDSDYNEVTLIFKNSEVIKVPKMKKNDIASIIIDKAVKIYRSKNA